MTISDTVFTNATKFEIEAELLERVEALLPTLRSRASLAEEQRCIPEETIQDLADIGLFRMHVPAAYGGLELGIDSHFRIFRTLARGCMSTAWTMSFLTIHNNWYARWPREIQDEVFGERGYLFASGSNQARGETNAVSVEGGFILNGRWGFNSGVVHAHRCHVSCQIDGDPSNKRMFSVPREQVDMLDNWDATGMRGTGSNDIEIRDLFVPEKYTIDTDFYLGDNEGTRIWPDFDMLRFPVHRLVCIQTAAYVLGGADRALELFRDQNLPGRRVLFSGKPKVESPIVQSRFARILLNLHTASLLMEHQIATVMESFGRGETLDLETTAMMQLDSVGAITSAGEAVEMIGHAAGGTIHSMGNELCRILRDVQVLLAHSTADWDYHSEMIGSVHLGQGTGDRPLRFT